MTNKGFIDVWLPLSDAFYRVAFHLLESEQDAQDAVQDLYVKLWKDRDALDGIRNPKAYGLTLIRNICIDRIRKQTGARTSELIEMTDGSDTQSRLEDKQELYFAVKAFDRLSPTQRSILQMHVFEDITYDEMAERTGMSKLTLRVLLCQARRKIRNAR